MMGKKRVYIAYGSNLNKEQMARRCPGARFIGTGYLEGWQLVYRGTSRRQGVATIRQADGDSVPVGIWSITRSDERALDIYEGYPHLYRKYRISVEGNDEVSEGMVYIMTPGHRPAAPFDGYVDTIYQGYMDCGLDGRYLLDSLRRNLRELKVQRGEV